MSLLYSTSKNRFTGKALTALTLVMIVGSAHAIDPSTEVSSDGEGLYGSALLQISEDVFNADNGDVDSSSGAKINEGESYQGIDSPKISDFVAEGVTLESYDEDGSLPYALVNELLELNAVDSGLEEKSTGTESAEIIIGRDTRVRINPRAYPSRAVTLVTFSGGRCSGVLIGKDTVMTAGHCVHSGPSGTWRTNVRVWPGYDQNSAPYGFCTAKRLYTVAGWALNGDEKYDYGAVKLNCTVGNAVGWFGFFTQSASLTNFPAIISGYPGDKPLQQWQSSDKVSVTQDQQLFYLNDTTGGMSGSAVWYDRNGPSAMGIHAYGTHGNWPHSSYNHGTRITPAVFNNLIAWRNAL